MPNTIRTFKPSLSSTGHALPRSPGPDAEIGGVGVPVSKDLADRSLSGGAPLVHPQQTSVNRTDGFSYRGYVSRAVKPHLARYDMILDNSDSLTSQKHLDRLRGCRTRAWFTVSRSTRAVRVASSRCNLRWCPMCQQTKRYIIANGVAEWIEKAKNAKFLTLTLRSSDNPLQAQLKSLYVAFRKFRRRKFPKDLIRGGFWFFQVTYNNSTHQWHPHIHCLIDSDYLPQRKLSGAWRSASNGSSVVDIRTVTDAVRGAQYVARYATSPASLLSLTPLQGYELIGALVDQRIVGAWGTARGVPLAPRKPEDAGDWIRAYNFKSVIATKHLHGIFEELYECWRSGKPYEGDLAVLELGCSIPADVIRHDPECYETLELEFSGPIAVCGFVAQFQSAGVI